MRLLKNSVFVALVLILASINQQAKAQTTLTVGPGDSDFGLQPNTANQILHIYVRSTASPTTSGANLILDLGAGAPSTGIGSITGTVYDGGSLLPDLDPNPYGLNIGILGTIPFTTIDNSGSQILATLLLDTSGLNSGTFNLNFAGTTVNDAFAQPIPYSLTGASTVTISSVPEPHSIGVFSLAGLVLLRRRRI